MCYDCYEACPQKPWHLGSLWPSRLPAAVHVDVFLLADAAAQILCLPRPRPAKTPSPKLKRRPRCSSASTLPAYDPATAFRNRQTNLITTCTAPVAETTTTTTKTTTIVLTNKCSLSVSLSLSFEKLSVQLVLHLKRLGSKVNIPSGNLLHSYGKSPFLMGKSTINGHFQ